MKAILSILLAIVMVGLTVAPALGAPGSVSAGVATRQTGTLVPMLLDYQGRLADAGGNPLNGSYTVVFSIYSVPTGGTAIWSESQTVTVTQGLFSVLLGSQVPLTVDLFTASAYLGVRVGTDAEMTPRQRLVSVPYAVIAERARTLDVPLTLQLSYNGNLLQLVNPTGGVLRAESQGTAIQASNTGDLATIVSRNDGTGKAIEASSRGSAAATVYATNTGGDRALEARSQGNSQAAIFAENSLVGGGGAIEALSHGNTRATLLARNDGSGRAIEASSKGTEATVLAENTGAGLGAAIVARSQESRRGESTVLAENTGTAIAITASSRGVNDPAIRAVNTSSGGAISATSTGEYRPTIYAENTVNGLAIGARSPAISDILRRETNATVFAENTGGGIALGARSASGLFGTVMSNNTGTGRAIEATSQGTGHATVFADNQGGGPALGIQGKGEDIMQAFDSLTGTRVFGIRGQGGGILALSRNSQHAAVLATNDALGGGEGGLAAAVEARQTGDGWSIVASNRSDTKHSISAWNEEKGGAIAASNGRSSAASEPTIWAINLGTGPVLKIEGSGEKLITALDSREEVFHVMSGGGAMSFASHPEQPAFMGIHRGANNAFYGTSEGSIAGYFQTRSAIDPALEGVNLSGGRSFVGVGDTWVQGNGYFTGNIAAANLKTAIVDTESYGKRKLYAMESPTVVFEDFGTAPLVNGYARVHLEPVFAQTVNTELTYQVFLTPLGESRGLFVAEKTPTHFTVRESGGGTASVNFDYRVVAKRKGYEGLRMEEVSSAEAPQVGR